MLIINNMYWFLFVSVGVYPSHPISLFLFIYLSVCEGVYTLVFNVTCMNVCMQLFAVTKCKIIAMPHLHLLSMGLFLSFFLFWLLEILWPRAYHALEQRDPPCGS